MLCANDLRHFIIRDTLKRLDEWSPAAENLLLGTAAQESGLGNKLKAGRMLGLYHLSPQTHQAVWDKYLINYPDLASRVRGLASQRGFLSNPHGELITNLNYATAIAWLVYKRNNQALPAENDIKGLAKFWRRHFHAKAVATEEDFIKTWRRISSPRAASMAA